MSNTDPISNGQVPVQEIQHRRVSTDEQAPPSPEPLPAEQFGLAIGRIMDRFGIVELPVATATGTEVGTLQLSTGTLGRITQTCVAWEHIEASEIQQHIHDIAGRDLPLDCGVFAAWDSAGLQRLDAHRAEIMASLVATVAVTTAADWEKWTEAARR